MSEAPPLAWCFQVLRNAIGNHYQRERTRRLRTVEGESLPERPDARPQPLEALESKEAVRMIHEALNELERSAERCAHYLRSIAAGVSLGVLASEDVIEEPVLYRRLYRCRQKLRELLHARGIVA